MNRYQDGVMEYDAKCGIDARPSYAAAADAELCAAMEGAVAELVADGTYAKIAENYPDIINNLIFLGQ